MTHEEKDKLLAQKDAELEELRQKAAELEAKNQAAEEETAIANQKAAEAAEALENLKAKEQERRSCPDSEKTAAVALKREKIFIPRAAHSKDDPNLVVGFNGKLYVLPKGKESEVPVEVAQEIRRSWKAAENYDNTRARKLEEVAQAEAQMNQKIN